MVCTQTAGEEGGGGGAKLPVEQLLLQHCMHTSTPWGADLPSCSPLQLSTNSLGHKLYKCKGGLAQ